MAEDQKPGVDAFSQAFPLPYRVTATIVLGIWLWGVNVHCCSLFEIDIENLIEQRHRSVLSGPTLHARVYRLALAASLNLVASLILFWRATRFGDPSWVYELLPHLCLGMFLVCFFLPVRRLSMVGRYRFLTVLRRISIGGIAEAQEDKFGDILLADALTSYSKVLADFSVSLCMLFSGERLSTVRLSGRCGDIWLTPFTILVPSLIRFRQCLTEHFRAQRSAPGSPPSGTIGHGTQHLANAAKYISAAPVVVLAVLSKERVDSTSHHTHPMLYRLWVFSLLTNSTFTFYWDVTRDWDLNLFGSQMRTRADHAWGLRRRLMFHYPPLYYFAIVMDFALRFNWGWILLFGAWKAPPSERYAYFLTFLEIFRRWIWVFFRAEAEYLRSFPSPDQAAIPLQPYAADLDSGAFD